MGFKTNSSPKNKFQKSPKKFISFAARHGDGTEESADDSIVNKKFPATPMLKNKRKLIVDQETPTTPGGSKRIKFSENLTLVKLYEKGSQPPVVSASKSSPGRSILKSASSTPLSVVKNKKLTKKMPKKIEDASDSENEPVEKVVPPKKTNVTPIKKDETSSESSAEEDYPTIVVPAEETPKKKKAAVVVPVENTPKKKKNETSVDVPVEETPKKKKKEAAVVAPVEETPKKKKKEAAVVTPVEEDKKENSKGDSSVGASEKMDTDEVHMTKKQKKEAKRALTAKVEEEEQVVIVVPLKADKDEDEKMEITSTEGVAPETTKETKLFTPLTAEERDRVKLMSPEERTQFYNARYYETCKGMTKNEKRAFMRESRMKKKPHVHLAFECKQIWEKLRMNKTTQEEKIKLAGEALEKMKGQMMKLVVGRDTSRVIQSILYLGHSDYNKVIVDELTPNLLHLCRSKFAAFFVTLLFEKSDAARRDDLFRALRGHVAKLYDVIYSAKVIDILYNQIANEVQKFDLLCEFFGKEYVIFRQTDNFKDLNELLLKNPEKKPLILKNMLSTIKNFIPKSTLSNDFSHVLINEYLNHCNEEQKKEVAELLRDKILDLTNKKHGCEVAAKIIYLSNAKDRKNIIKGTKTLVSSIAMDQYGSNFILALVEGVDDTVNVNKTIITEIIEHLPDMVKSRRGCAVIQHIVQPGETQSVGEFTIKLLKEGESSEHSKKPKADRALQVYEGLKDSLLDYVKQFCGDIFKSKGSVHLLGALLEQTKSEYLFDRAIPDDLRQHIYKKIAEIMEELYDPEEVKGHKFFDNNVQAKQVVRLLLDTDNHCEIKFLPVLKEINKECHKFLPSFIQSVL
uniref:PUM-HD domain-containing protein n=1 Tax=Rhabditophanes sp. KR3021 TaxID=114890 RepID=A0AC35UFM9_9BILA